MPSDAIEQLKVMIAATVVTPEMPLVDQRAGIDGIGQLIPLADGTTVEPVDAGGVPAEVVRPPGREGPPVLLHLHGGGYVIGSAASHRPFASRLAAGLGAPVLVTDYRLAPEHPYPAALEDTLAAWQWLAAGSGDPARLALSGDSAGAGLAVTLLCRLRDAGRPLPAAAALVSPWVDLTGTAPSITRNADRDVMLRADTLAWWARSFAGDVPLDDPVVSPLHGSLAGLPPLLVQHTDAELLADDADRLVAAAGAAGVDVTATVAADLVHDWHLFAGVAPEADEAVAAMAAFLRSHLA